jgi:hypothetical protein
MTQAFGLDYAALIGLSLGGFIAFGAVRYPPAGWGSLEPAADDAGVFLRHRRLSDFYRLSHSPTMLVIGSDLIGIFAAIYHPVGTAMLVAYAETRPGDRHQWHVGQPGRGVFGAGHRAAGGALRLACGVHLPGVVAMVLGVGFALQVREEPSRSVRTPLKGAAGQRISMALVFGVLALATATGGVVFNATTMTYPKLFQERLHELFASPQTLGVVVSLAYAFGAVAQLSIGRVLHRVSLKWPFVVLTMCQAPLLYALAYGEGWA